MRRCAVLVVTAVALTTACSGGSDDEARPTTSSAPSSSLPRTGVTTTTTAAPSGPLTISPAPWELPAPVSREVVVTDGDALFVLGGRNAAKVSVADAYRIDPVDGNATRFSALEPPVHDAAGVFVQDAPMVIGGGAPPIQRIVQSLKPNGEIVPLAEMPAPRADHVAALIGDTTYVLGGGDDAATLIPEVIAFDGTAWRSVGTLAEPVRYPAVAVIDDAVYLFGGVSSSEGTDTASVQRYDPATGTTQVVAELPTPLSHASAVLLGGRVYVVGGYVNNVASAQVLAFDPSAGTFTPAGDLDAPRTDAGVVTIGDTGYLVGGESADGAVATVTLLRV